MKILIVTTALNRSDLHNSVLNSYKKFLKKTDQVTWLINIDRIDALQEPTSFTEKNIRRMYKSYKNVKFYFLKNNDGRGYFNLAVRKLVNKAKGFVDKVDYVMYLEDDYQVREDLNKLDYQKKIKEFGDTKKDHFTITLANTIGKRRRDAFTFPPQIWSIPMFKKFINVYDTITDPDNCPEWILNNHFDKVNGTDIDYGYYHIPSFNGARLGRRWLSNKGLVKVGNFYEVRDEVDMERNRMFYAGKGYGSDKITEHHYYKYYDMFLKDFYDAQGCLLEIGVFKGNSIKMWQAVFPNMFIYGADIKKYRFKVQDKNRYQFIKCDQSSEESLEKLKDTIERPLYVVVDDGSHIPEHQLLTFNKVFPKIYNRGIYIIEDVETSYWNGVTLGGHHLKGSVTNPKNIVNIFKKAAHAVNSHMIDVEKGLEISEECLETIETITFAQNCIIIKKGLVKDPEKYRRKRLLHGGRKSSRKKK